MAIKVGRFKILVLLFIVISINIYLLGGAQPAERVNKGSPSVSAETETEVILPDKVYTFPPDVEFENLYLEKDYMYFIYVELVVPFDVEKMKITLWDPNGKQYDLFEAPMHAEEPANWFEIPFGAVISGDYKIDFSVTAHTAVNVLISMEKSVKCLYDKIDGNDLENIVFYEVSRFENTMTMPHPVNLTTDNMYKFYIGRVTAISIIESNEISVSYDLIDPNGIKFNLYFKEELKSVDEIPNHFSFGTSIGGEYTIKITIDCKVAVINVAYLIIDDYLLAAGINQTYVDRLANQ